MASSRRTVALVAVVAAAVGAGVTYAIDWQMERGRNAERAEAAAREVTALTCRGGGRCEVEVSRVTGDLWNALIRTSGGRTFCFNIDLGRYEATYHNTGEGAEWDFRGVGLVPC